MNKRITKIVLTTETAKSVPYNQFLGYEGEDNIAELVFEFSDGFVDGRAKLVLLREDMEPGYLDLERVDDTYVLPVKSALISKNGDITFCLTIINDNNDIIVKYDPFVMTVKDAPDTDIPMPEDYPTWSKLADDKLMEMDNAIKQLEEDVASGKFDGKDYIITEEDKEEIKRNAINEITPELEKIVPKKTSELVNDSSFAVTNNNNNFSTSQTINGDLTINGNIVQNGEEYETHAEQVYTKMNDIILREGAVGGMSIEEFAGLVATLYNGINNGRLGFKADGTAYVGDVGDEQPLLTRDMAENLISGQVLVWDGTNLKAIGSSDFVKNTDTATSTRLGLAKMWTSVNEDGEIGLNISTEV